MGAFDGIAVTIGVRDLLVAEITTLMAGEEWPAALADYTPPVMGVYSNVWRISELDGGRVIVMPANRDDATDTRGSANSCTVEIDLAVQFKYTDVSDLASIDPYMAMMEFFAQQFKTMQLNGAALQNGATCTGVKFKFLWVPKHMEDFSVFSSVLGLTFFVSEAKTP